MHSKSSAPVRPRSPRVSAAEEAPRLEAALVQAVVANMETYLRRRVDVFTEVVAGRSIADVVAVRGGRATIARPLSVWESAILAAVRRLGSTRIDVLERVCGFHAQGLRGEDPRFGRLVKTGLLRRGRGGAVQVGVTWGRSFQIIAIEAKLTRWREALSQAVEYRQYADRAYVALPEAAIPHAKRHRAEFEAVGVGLLSVNGHVRTIVRAKPATDHDWRREFLWSRLALPNDRTH